jgi:antibiotic biosynthesis monooxygenase (ABM) superfamily enzyme
MWFDKVAGMPIWFWTILFLMSIIFMLLAKTLLIAIFSGGLALLSWIALCSYCSIGPDDFKF